MGALDLVHLRCMGYVGQLGMNCFTKGRETDHVQRLYGKGDGHTHQNIPIFGEDMSHKL